MNANFTQVLEAIQELREDVTVPKNIKTKLYSITEILNNGEDMSMKVNKALHELDDISDDVNIEPYTRPRIWNIASLLEGI